MRFLSNGPKETFDCGFALGGRLKKGDIVCLYGDLGSGKTTFVKGIGVALSIPEKEITSASFTIIAEYTGMVKNASVPFYHIDLYRIGGTGELDSLGLEEYIGKNGIAVIEWAERLDDAEECITVRFAILDERRREITIEGADEADWHNM